MKKRKPGRQRQLDFPVFETKYSSSMMTSVFVKTDCYTYFSNIQIYEFNTFGTTEI